MSDRKTFGFSAEDMSLQDAAQVFAATDLCIECAEPLPNHAADCATLRPATTHEATLEFTVKHTSPDPTDNSDRRIKAIADLVDEYAAKAAAHDCARDGHECGYCAARGDDFRAPLTLKISVARKVNLGIAVGSAETYAEVSNVTKDTTEAEILELLEGAGGVAWRAVANDVTAKVRQLREKTER